MDYHQKPNVGVSRLSFRALFVLLFGLSLFGFSAQSYANSTEPDPENGVLQ